MFLVCAKAAFTNFKSSSHLAIRTILMGCLYFIYSNNDKTVENYWNLETQHQTEMLRM